VKLKELFEKDEYGDAENGIITYTVHGQSTVKFGDKDSFLRFLLKHLQSDHPHVISWIRDSRRAGFDYPEFKAIEKSIGKIAENASFVALKDPGITVWDHEANKNMVIPFSDKKMLLKFMLGVLKKYNDPVDKKMEREWIAASRKAGYDYPEFKSIEKSIGKINEMVYKKDGEEGLRISVRGTSRKPELKFVPFSNKKELMRAVLRMYKKELFHSMKDSIKACRDAGFDYPEFKMIEKSAGEIKEAKGSYAIYGDDGRFTFADKDKFIKHLLRFMKTGERGDEDHGWIRSKVLWWIKMSREDGYDYPEFKPIEKSLGKIAEGNNDGISDYNADGSKSVIRFRDKEKFIKLALQELRSGNIHEVLHWIKMCRDAGYDYPEFKTIEKSAGK